MTSWPFDPALKAWGATYEPAAVKPGQPYWQLVEAAGPMDIGGNHHLYVDVWDEQGNRIVGVKVMFYSMQEEWTMLTEAKKGEPYAVNLPLYAGGNAYGVWINDGGIESDTLFGVGLGDHVAHHSFRAIFRRTVAGGVTMPEPPAEPPVKPPSRTPLTARDVIAMTRDFLAALEATL